VSGPIVLYDGDCGFCRVMLAALLKWDRAARLSAVTIQSARGQDLLDAVAPQDRLDSWHLLDAAGVLRSGGAAVPAVFQALPYGAPIARIASGFPRATARAYIWVASHRALLGRALGERARAWAGGVIAERERLKAS
jgi:predicted DCC family thiol-disulfide oxidoreductase YuxK